jgi:hypothetical protein
MARGNSVDMPRGPRPRIVDENGRPVSDDVERPVADNEEGSVDVDAPGRSLVDEDVDAVEPNEPA